MLFYIFIALILVSIAVYVTFLLLSAFFAAKRSGQLLILFALLVIGLGFVISSSLIRSFDSLVIRIFYIFCSLGLGLLFYLTIFAIIFQACRLIKLPVSRIILARIGVGLAVSLFLVGIFDANMTRVKNISVTMDGLPLNWQGKKIIQISDVHLGVVYGVGYLHRQVDRINALNPDLIVITGDLFDGESSRLLEFGPELSKLKAKEGIVYVPGNHETYLGLDKVEALLKGLHFKILRDEAVNIKGLEIIGLDFNRFAVNNADRNIKNLSSYNGQARLLLNHTPTEILFAKKLKVDLQLSGHSHRGQMFPLSLMTQLIYGKYQYGLYTEGNYNIYTSSGLGSWGPPVRTFNPSEIVEITIK